MKSCFYRPTKINIKEMTHIVANVRQELRFISQKGIQTEAEAIGYIEDLAGKLELCNYNPELYFWGLDQPENMPSDARVDFVYVPTYCLTASLIALIAQYPLLLEQNPVVLSTLKRGLYASSGRNFVGAGYDQIDGLLDTMEIFAHAPVSIFLKTHSDICPKFTALWRKYYLDLKDSLRTGKASVIPSEWSGVPVDYSAEILRIITLVETAK